MAMTIHTHSGNGTGYGIRVIESKSNDFYHLDNNNSWKLYDNNGIKRNVIALCIVLCKIQNVNEIIMKSDHTAFVLKL